MVFNQSCLAEQHARGAWDFLGIRCLELGASKTFATTDVDEICTGPVLQKWFEQRVATGQHELTYGQTRDLDKVVGERVAKASGCAWPGTADVRDCFTQAGGLTVAGAGRYVLCRVDRASVARRCLDNVCVVRRIMSGGVAESVCQSLERVRARTEGCVRTRGSPNSVGTVYCTVCTVPLNDSARNFGLRRFPFYSRGRAVCLHVWNSRSAVHIGLTPLSECYK